MEFESNFRCRNFPRDDYPISASNWGFDHSDKLPLDRHSLRNKDLRRVKKEEGTGAHGSPKSNHRLNQQLWSAFPLTLECPHRWWSSLVLNWKVSSKLRTSSRCFLKLKSRSGLHCFRNASTKRRPYWGREQRSWWGPLAEVFREKCPCLRQHNISQTRVFIFFYMQKINRKVFKRLIQRI